VALLKSRVLAAVCVMHVLVCLVSSSEDNVVSLDGSSMGAPAELGEGLTINPKGTLRERYISLRSDDWDDEEEEAEADYFVRHLGRNIVLTTLGGPVDRRNGAWIVREPLCQPGFQGCPPQPAGTTSCFSMESADNTNHFLAKDVKTDEIRMRRLPFADIVSATFCAHPGKADPEHLSLESLAKAGFFVTHKEFKLVLCNNEEKSACGKSERFNSETTFTEKPSGFMGTCENKYKDGRKVGRPKCKCIEDYVGKNCDVGCIGGCGKHGTCTIKPDAGEAFCECETGHVGSMCENACPVNEVTGTSCGSRGQCNLEDGTPVCQCGENYRGDSCQYHCPGYDLKAGVCSSHGQCALTDSPGPNETPTKCNCDDGFLGGSCEIKCPVDPVSNDVCSGHGSCALDKETAKSICQCHRGFAGDLCEFTCPQNLEGQECNGQGQCAVQEDSSVAGAMCVCDLGFAGPGCEEACPGRLAGVPCSGHGRCSFVGTAGTSSATAEDEAQEVVQEAMKDNEAPASSRQLLVKHAESVGKRAVCTCEEGYGGEDCAISCPRDENGSVCTGHGKCNLAGECICATGFVGSGCQAGCPGTAEASATPCNENGECTFDPTTGRAQCTCNEGFLGPSCKLMCPRGGSTLDICSARGKCVIQRGVAACICEEGFLGDNCGLACPGADAGSVCGDHGHCESDAENTKTFCLCQEGFKGLSCAIECPGTQEDGQPCNGRGKCTLEEGNVAVCTCPSGYLGNDCALKCPTDAYGNVCSGAGSCVEKEHEDGVLGTACECKLGHVNFNCDSSCPINSADGQVCSGHGACEVTESTDISGQSNLRGSCLCNEGYLGDDCAHGCPTSEGNALPCSGHGVCAFVGGSAACQCESGWVGSSCTDRACVSSGSVFLNKIDKCQCETGYTCCSRETEEQEGERDATIAMMLQQKKLARSKLTMLQQRLKRQ